MLLIGSVSPDHTKPSQEVPVTPNQTTKSSDSGPREHMILKRFVNSLLQPVYKPTWRAGRHNQVLFAPARWLEHGSCFNHVSRIFLSDNLC